MTLSDSTLETFLSIPRDEPVPAARLAVHVGEPEALRRIRRLEADHLVTATTRNPKAVRVSGRPFPRMLHGLLSIHPYYKPFVQGSALRIIAVLASDSRPLSVEELARKAGVHKNTVRNHIRFFLRRSILQTKGGYGLAPHVPELAQLGRFYRDHVLEEMLVDYPRAYPVLQRGTRLIVQSATEIEGPEATAAYRFQLEGADVLAYAREYALTLGEPTGLREAFDDFVALAPAPRTRAAVERFLRDRGENAA